MKELTNNIEQGWNSNKNMKQTEAHTQGKQARDYEYSIYQHTSFEAYRTQYFTLCEKIRKQRLIEYLGRYKSIQYKTSQLLIFKNNFLRIKQLLMLMTRQADKYRSLANTGGSVKDLKSVNISFDYEISFRKKIRKDLKDIQTFWIQLFIEGSLKRLIPILNLLRIPDDEIDFGFDITQWHIETQSKFSSLEKSKGCCCV